jgi:hypothetical protein
MNRIYPLREGKREDDYLVILINKTTALEISSNY